MLIYRKVFVAGVLSLSWLAAQETSVRPEIGTNSSLLRGSVLPTGARITPNAAPGSSMTKLIPGLPGLPAYAAGQPMTTAVSPDGRTLLVLTSGYNLVNGSDGNNITNAGSEFVFIYDISANKLTQRQALQVPTAFGGVAWNPSGSEFYVGGGALDTVFIFTASKGSFSVTGTVAFNHPNPAGLGSGLGLGMPSVVAGLSVNARGDRLLAANYLNDSVTIVDIPNRKVITELDLRPGVADPTKVGVAGGEYPFWISIKGNDKAYISSVRDREIVVLGLANDKPAVTKRIAVQGNPNKMILNKAQSLLMAAEDNADAVVVIDTNTDAVLDTIYATAPSGSFVSTSYFLKGSNTNSLALSPDEKTLYATNGGTNSVAVISLNTYSSPSHMVGLIPTAWYPDAVAVSSDGSTLFVAHTKNVPGPNPGNCTNTLGTTNNAACNATNEYVLQLEKGGMLTIPVPGRKVLDSLTAQVEQNNNFNQSPAHDRNLATMAQLRAKIQHVIYVVKENRTYDQILGDLEKGNGDPALTLFGAPYTPNQHQVARQFVTLDNFYDSGEVSGVGWNWSTAARATDSVEKTVPISYAGRFGPTFYDYEGSNRNINVGYAALGDRLKADPATPQDPNLLPGAVDINAPDSSEGDVGMGYLWNGALRHGLTVRNYGFYLDLTRYNLPPSIPLNIPISTTPFASNMVQAYSSKPELQPLTDPYFRGFDNNYPDFYRFQEWSREFDGYVQGNNLPSLSLVRFMHDHTGSFASAGFGINTVESQVADNDYAVGLLLEKLSNSPYAGNTLVFVIEDDAQDGPDHVDAHRSTAYIAGPYVKQNAVVSNHYTTVNFVRTMKDVLGIPYFGIGDGTAEPMADVFDLGQASWKFTSTVPAILRNSQLPLPVKTSFNSLPDTKRNLLASKPRHSAQWWAKRMAGQDFDKEDDLDTVDYNHVLWKGMKGNVPYPSVRDGRDLSQNRKSFLQ